MNELEKKLMSTATAKQWAQIGVRHHHGIALPLSALHSNKSCGIGEYLDLIPLFSWCQSVGMDVIQLLPLNDTGLGTSPYDALSAFALSPTYLSLHALPHLELVPQVDTKLKKIAYWIQTDRVKHHIVRELKNVFFKEYIPLILPLMESNEAFGQFKEQNKYWLEPYALFKALKEKHYWKKWEDWAEEFRNPNPVQYQQALISMKEAIAFHEMLQFLCFQQLNEVQTEAQKRGIFLKGDIPILINRDSVDVWRHRHLFLLDYEAGAPPDMYAPEGQNWGFPLYNWPALQSENYAWWRQRLSYATNFYHIYRIDHVVGFFRIWAINKGQPGRLGKYLPEQSDQWIPLGTHAMNFMISGSSMLPIGEDLGSVPPEVRAQLSAMGICGTKVMRWERRYQGDGGYIHPSDYNPISMTTVSTHDSDTLQLWWKHEPKEARLFTEYKGWDYVPFLTREHHLDILKDSHRSGSLFHINLLQEYLALFPSLTSLHASDERINVPGKILDTNWTYRFKPSVEQLLSHNELKESVKDIVKGGSK